MRRLIALFLLSVSSCESPTTPPDLTIASADMLMTPTDMAMTPRDMAVAPADMVTTRDMAATPKDMTVVLTPCVLGQSMINLCKL